MAFAKRLAYYAELEEKIGKESAEDLLQFIAEHVKEEIEIKKDYLATKEDIASVKIDVANSKADTIKWMFIFWIGQIAATFGFILLFLKR